MSTAMAFRYFVRALILVTAVPDVLAATQNVTLVAGSSSNITFSGGGWEGPSGQWTGLDPENELCSSPAGMYSSTIESTVTIVFQGTAIYFVGWNNSRDAYYAPNLDGVEDSLVFASASKAVPYCNLVQYKQTGLPNIQHTLSMKFTLGGQNFGNISSEMAISGVIITTDDNNELPLSIAASPSAPTPSTTDGNGIVTPIVSDNSQGPNFPTPTDVSSTDIGSFSAIGSKPLSTEQAISSSVSPGNQQPQVTLSNGSPVSTSSPAAAVSNPSRASELPAMSVTPTSATSQVQVTPVPTSASQVQVAPVPTSVMRSSSAAAQTTELSTTANIPLSNVSTLTGMTAPSSAVGVSALQTSLDSNFPTTSPTTTLSSGSIPPSLSVPTPSTTDDGGIVKPAVSDSQGPNITTPTGVSSTDIGSFSATGSKPLSLELTGASSISPNNRQPQVTLSNGGLVSTTDTAAAPNSSSHTSSVLMASKRPAMGVTHLSVPPTTSSQVRVAPVPASATLPSFAAAQTTVLATIANSPITLLNTSALTGLTAGMTAPSSALGGSTLQTKKTSSDYSPMLSPLLATTATSLTSTPPSGSVLSTSWTLSPSADGRNTASAIVPSSSSASSNLPPPTGQPRVDPTMVGEGGLTSAPFRPSSLPSDDPVLSTPSNDERPVLPTPDNGTPLSATTSLRASRKASRPKAIIMGSVIGGILGAAGIIASASLANHLHKIRRAKKAKKAFKSKGREFNFVVPPPPYVPGSRQTESHKSYQITLTLTPVDIEEGYTYQEVVWQSFVVTQSDILKTRTFTAKLDYDRAFGAANIRTGGDAINAVAFSDQPKCFEHAKPGRPIPFKGYAWANPLQFIARKYTRIIARNEDHVPLRLVIGSYVREQDQRESDYRTLEEGKHARLWDSMPNEGVAFQSFVVMDDKIGYGEQVSASLDLILRVYKTEDVEVGQVLSPIYVKHKAVPLLGERGIKLSKLPRIATWLVDAKGSDIGLKMQAPGLWQSLSQYL